MLNDKTMRSDDKKKWTPVEGVNYIESGTHGAHKLFELTYTAPAGVTIKAVKAVGENISFFPHVGNPINVKVLRENNERFLAPSLKRRVKPVDGGRDEHTVWGEILAEYKELVDFDQDYIIHKRGL